MEKHRTHIDPKDLPAPHSGGGEQPSRGMPGDAMPSGVKNLLGRYARWTGLPGTLKSWLTQAAGVGRTP